MREPGTTARWRCAAPGPPAAFRPPSAAQRHDTVDLFVRVGETGVEVLHLAGLPTGQERLERLLVRRAGRGGWRGGRVLVREDAQEHLEVRVRSEERRVGKEWRSRWWT